MMWRNWETQAVALYLRGRRQNLGQTADNYRFESCRHIETYCPQQVLMGYPKGNQSEGASPSAVCFNMVYIREHLGVYIALGGLSTRNGQAREARAGVFFNMVATRNKACL